MIIFLAKITPSKNSGYINEAYGLNTTFFFSKLEGHETIGKSRK